jgi:hypothetical protein
MRPTSVEYLDIVALIATSPTIRDPVMNKLIYTATM